MVSSGSTIMTAMAPSTIWTARSCRSLLRASGVSANVAAMTRRGRSALGGAFHDQVGHEIHCERDGEEQDADHEQHLVVIRADGSLSELGGDRRRQRAHRIERALRDV